MNTPGFHHAEVSGWVLAGVRTSSGHRFSRRGSCLEDAMAELRAHLEHQVDVFTEALAVLDEVEP